MCERECLFILQVGEVGVRGEWGRGLYFDWWKVDNHVLGCDGILSKGDCFSGESTEIKKILKIRGGASALMRLGPCPSDR